MAREARLGGPTLQGEEITDVLRFLASLRYFEPTGSPFWGNAFFAERGCASCHGPSARVRATGPKLRAGADAFTMVSFAHRACGATDRPLNARAESSASRGPTWSRAMSGELIAFLNDPGRKK